ncbi:kinase-like domain-containing protein [Clohesyomyces aquaticus]|uniref:mitogen-activated protein kinase kinase n=1 Tax=Clohesyomyces aquaticus TaxID=1231657 RepID=A0A1Y1YZE4_9PLEO|nr:kinase-like domain-containing protein [Clohesyomyces aquaticus]
MSRLPDLVRDSQLDTQVRPEYTRHLYVETDPTSGQRAIEKKEYWKREKRIGSGGIGIVWLEKCFRGKRNAELRAVKQFPRPAKTRDLVRELEALAKFSHPKYVRCFVQSFGWYEDEDDLYIAMEYLPLGDLNNYLKAAGPVPELEVQQVVFQLLEGLSNILICSLPPQNWWVKLADFGISKRVEDCTTGPSTKKGTAGFVPPEFHGFTPSGEDTASDPPFSADIWALGEITFRMLTKSVTFQSSYDLFQFTEGRQTFPIASLEEKRVSMPAIEFVRACMRPSAGDRLTAPEAMAYEWMSAFVARSPIPHSVVSFGYSIIAIAIYFFSLTFDQR